MPRREMSMIELVEDAIKRIENIGWFPYVVRPDKPELGECYIWKGGLFSAGYAHFSFRAKHTKVIRFLLWQAGQLPSLDFDLQIRHACAEPLCVNPAHLSPGTRKDNAQDRLEEGKYGSGRITKEGRLNLKRGFCASGKHSRIEENIQPGSGACILCHNEKIRSRYKEACTRRERYQTEYLKTLRKPPAIETGTPELIEVA